MRGKKVFTLNFLKTNNKSIKIKHTKYGVKFNKSKLGDRTTADVYNKIEAEMKAN